MQHAGFVEMQRQLQTNDYQIRPIYVRKSRKIVKNSKKFILFFGHGFVTYIFLKFKKKKKKKKKKLMAISAATQDFCLQYNYCTCLHCEL